MFSTHHPPSQIPPSPTPRGGRSAGKARMRMRQARAVSLSDPDGMLNRRCVRRTDARLTSSESTSRYWTFKIKELERGKD